MSNKRTRLLLSGLCVVIILICILVCVRTTVERKEIVDTYAELKDGAMISYLSCMEYTDDLPLLYEIGNEQSYRKAKSTLRMSDDMYRRYFTTEKYTGALHNYESSIVEIKCAVPEETVTLSADSTYKYLVTIQQTDTDTKTTEIIYAIVTYTDGMLTNLVRL